MSASSGIAAGRLDAATLARNFAEAFPPLTPRQAVIQAERCYFCHDAPCVAACPTGIDIPRFIRGIVSGNLRGAGETILRENILGGSCARVCPTEILCEGACVRTAQEGEPVSIGALQRHATDFAMARGQQPFSRAAPTGKRVAVIGAGPAGLACAHRLAVHGYDVVIFEARAKPGGLNEYGIAAYKMTPAFAQEEVAFLLSIGGIAIEREAVGDGLTIASLRARFDAVFLGIGLAGVQALAIEGSGLSGVLAAVDFIAALRQADDKSVLPVGRRVVVIGGGNTAIDAATQARRLGAEEVTMVYRRGREQMSATVDEQDWAQTNGVRIMTFASPVRLIGEDGAVAGVEFARTRFDEGRLIADGEHFILAADMVLVAIGQVFVADSLGDATALAIEGGRIVVDQERRTSVPGVYAGGDCVAGQDLTVAAVQDGKVAAEAIHRDLMTR